MPTKFARRRCICCHRSNVIYKMPSIEIHKGRRRVFFCWLCAQALYNRFVNLKIFDPPDKATLLSKTTKVLHTPKRKQETN